MIYFIQDTRTFEIKIGFTAGDSADCRLTALQTGNPAELRLLFTMPGDFAFEAELHRRFVDYRTTGEWFRPAPALLAFLLEESRDDGVRGGFGVGTESVRDHLQEAYGNPEYPDFRWLQESKHLNLAPDQTRRAFDVLCPSCGSNKNVSSPPEILRGSVMRGFDWESDFSWQHSDDGTAVCMCCEGCGQMWTLCVTSSWVFAVDGHGRAMEASPPGHYESCVLRVGERP